MDLIFHGPLGMELSLDRSAGIPRVKAAEHDSPALLVVGRALTAIEGVPVGEIRDKNSWLAVVAKLQAPERPLSLTFETPASPPSEKNPVAAEERARAEVEAVASAPAPAPTRGRAYSRGGPRSRSPSPELTCEQCGRKGTRADGFFRALVGRNFCSEACKAKSLGRSAAASSSRRRRSRSRSRSPRRRCEASPERSNRHDTAPPRQPRPPSPPGLGQRPTRRHLVAAAESARAPQLPVESEPAANGPSDDFIRERIFARALARGARDHQRADGILAELGRAGVRLEFVDSNSLYTRDLVRWSTADGRSGPTPPDDDAIFGLVLAREKARIAKDYAAADRLRAEMTASGFDIVYRDATGRPDKNRGAVTWSTVDGREGPPSMSRIEIETRLRAWLHARNVDKNPGRARDLLADCAARGLTTSTSGTGQWTWFTAQGQSGPMPSLEGDAPAAPPVPRETGGAGPSDEFIRERIFARALARSARDGQRADGILAELGRAGVRIEFVDSNSRDLVRWSTADGRSGPCPPSDAEIYDMVLAREKAKLAKDYAAADRIQAEMAASGFDVVYRDATGRPDKSRGAVTWFTVDGRFGPPALSTPDVESRLRAWLQAHDVEQNPSRARALLAECRARGIGMSDNWNMPSASRQWFTAQGKRGRMLSLDRNRSRSRSRSRSRRRRRGSSRRRRESSRSRSRSRSPRRSRYDTALPPANHYGPAPGKRPRPPSPPGLGHRPTRRHLVAAAPSEASSSDGY